MYHLIYFVWGVFMKKRLTCALLGFLTLLCIALTIVDLSKISAHATKPKALDKKPSYFIIVDIGEKRLYLLKDGKCIKKYPVATGKPGWPSPIGSWKIIEKGDWGEGFGGKWLGLNVPWGKYGIHGTTKESSVGSAASHGCIRMYNRHVRELYSIVPHGTPVGIVEGSFGPFGSGFKELEPGDRGADVMAIQQRLRDLGYFKGWVSGIYEDDLKLAVHTFQKRNGLPVTNAITRQCLLAMGFREFE